MDPLVNNNGFIRSMQIYNQFAQYGPPNALSIDVSDTREMFRNGSCAMTLDWANPFSFMASTRFADGYYASVTPGTYQVVDRDTGALVNCTRAICPHAEIGRTGQLLNRASFAAFGGWSGSVSGLIPQAKQDLAYAFLSFLGRPSTSSRDVTKGLGFDLYRYSHLNVSNWEASGFMAEYVLKMHDTFRTILCA
jgi:multiple sugar transport system substrate-binding protein